VAMMLDRCSFVAIRSISLSTVSPDPIIPVPMALRLRQPYATRHRMVRSPSAPLATGMGRRLGHLIEGCEILPDGSRLALPFCLVGPCRESGWLASTVEPSPLTRPSTIRDQTPRSKMARSRSPS
jgi:hypothetical protein